MLYQEYFQRAHELLKEVFDRQAENIIRAAQMVTDCVRRDGILFVFGCGHSHMIAEEMFYRAGGLAPVSAILLDELMLHKSAVGSSRMEQTEGISPRLFDEYKISPKDLLLIVSTSGVNAAPVEMALKAKRNGVGVLCVSSSAYANETPRHLGGARLSEIADLSLDNGVPLGDACVYPGGGTVAAGPVSTLLSAMLVNCIVVQVAENLEQLGIEAPVYRSGNVEGGAEQNVRLIEAYRERVRLLDPR